jgi:molecular chaperone GrpE (heat shock protein)
MTLNEVSAMSREEMLRRFERLLDSALAGEAPPAGIDPAILDNLAEGNEIRPCDSYALWAALTGLTQEIKLQGRAFQELNHTLDAHTSRLLDEVRAAYAERERNLQREAERRSRREVLNALIDLRDRLGRGHESASARANETRQAPQQGSIRSMFRRIFSKPDESAVETARAETVSALLRGYELTIQRLDQTLEEFNAREIRCEAAMFDPRRMNAIDSEESAAVPEGAVLEVYRSGYEWNGEVFRTAQVKVSRAPAVKPAETPAIKKDHE